MVMMSMRDKDAFEMAFLFMYERCDVSKKFRMVFDACVDHVARGASSNSKDIRPTHHPKIRILPWNHIDGPRLVHFDVSLAIQLLLQHLVNIFNIKVELIAKRNFGLRVISLLDHGSGINRV